MSYWGRCSGGVDFFVVPLKMQLKLLLAVLLSLFATSCTTMSDQPGAVKGSKIESDKSYELEIGKYSAGEAEYNGFYNNFIYKATLHNSEIRSNLLQRQNEYYKWDHSKLLSEADKMEKEAAIQTNIFLSFYTPDRNNDNLADTKTIWKIYLEVGGQRYEGKAKKLRWLIAEIQALYPYHTRWNTPYLLSFQVPMSTIEGQDMTLMLTGPLGTRSVQFPGKK